jgi:hypothetical protein
MAKTRSRCLNPLRFVEPVAVKPRSALIAEIAYFKAQSRGFEPGHEQEDWLAAEAEVDRRLNGSGSRSAEAP